MRKVHGVHLGRGFRGFVPVAIMGSIAALLIGSAARAVTPLPPTDPRTLETVSPPLTTFYTRPVRTAHGHSGELMRVQRIYGGPGVKAWRILYLSKDLAGKTTVVSGLVIVPAGRAPRRGFPVIAVAHGTTGASRHCGMSQAPFEPNTPGYSYYHRFFAYMLNAGFAVIATDYQGMGGPGPVAYLVAGITARNTLDSIRATGQLGSRAKGVPKLNFSRVVVYGHSEGGQTSAFVSQIARMYAPDVQLVGAVVSAPADPPNLTSQIDFYRSLPPNPLSGYAAMLDYSWGLIYRDRGFRTGQVLTSAATQLFGVLRNDCADAAAAKFTLKPTEYLRAPGPNYGPFFNLARENQPARARATVPILLIQGLSDVTVFPKFTDQVFGRMCAHGDRVLYRKYPGYDHKGVVPPSMPDVIAWATARLAGRPAPSSCMAG